MQNIVISMHPAMNLNVCKVTKFWLETKSFVGYHTKP